jgi:hypothetical protein
VADDPPPSTGESVANPTSSRRRFRSVFGAHPMILAIVVLTDANPSQMANLFAYRLIDDKTLF